MINLVELVLIHVCFCFQAEEFQQVVQVMREFLPQAEAELKFKSLPEDEVAIIQLIEKHEVGSCFGFLSSVSYTLTLLRFQRKTNS